MNLNQLLKATEKSKKRLGRGIGSGRGKTSGRGTKGQKARGKIPAHLKAGRLLYKRLPLKRGKGNSKTTIKPNVVSLEKLVVFKKGQTVDIQSLQSIGLIKSVSGGVKILGKVDKLEPLVIKVSISQGAKAIVEKMGGKVEDA